MSDHLPPPPKYRHYKPKNLAVVRINGRDHYLGRYGSAESKEKYARLIAEWATTGGAPPVAGSGSSAPERSDLTVHELLVAYWNHAESYYRMPAGEPSLELENIRVALRPVRVLYGGTPARAFGPLALRAVRDAMIRSGLAYTTINARINRVRRAFRWASSVELIPGSINHDLETVEPLRRGRSRARVPKEVQAVPIGDVERTLEFLPRPVAGMVRLQLLTGCRVGEVMAMRGCDITPGEPNWIYRPAQHKNAWRGQDRVIFLGPRAQAIVKEFLKPDTTAYLFDPRDAVAAHHAGRSNRRKSKPTPSERARKIKHAGRKHASRYDRRGYRQAIVRACDRANPHPTLSPLIEGDLAPAQREQLRELRRARREKKLTPERRTELNRSIRALLRRDQSPEQRAELKAWRLANRWSPLQLRHTAGTLIRAKFGLEASQVILGHVRADTTQIYAERDLAKAREVIAMIG